MKIFLFILAFLSLLLVSVVSSDERSNVDSSIEVLPEDYGKFGLTPFLGPMSDDSTRQTTLVFNKEIHGKQIAQVELLFFSSEKKLILASNNNFQCEEAKCFIEFGIIPDYQFNIEFEFVYGEEGKGDILRYRIKDIGLLLGRLNNTR